MITEPTATAATPRDTLRRPTVLVCDLVASTAIAEKIGEEALWELLLEYQDACSEVIHRFDGTVYKRLGDGLLALFGIPRASLRDRLFFLFLRLENQRLAVVLELRVFHDHRVGVDPHHAIAILHHLAFTGDIAAAVGLKHTTTGDTFSKPNGTYTYPTDPAYAHNAADLVVQTVAGPQNENSGKAPSLAVSSSRSAEGCA